MLAKWSFLSPIESHLPVFLKGNTIIGCRMHLLYRARHCLRNRTPQAMQGTYRKSTKAPFTHNT